MAKSIDDVREQAHEEFLKESAGWQVDTSGLPSIRDRQRAEAEKNKKPEKPFAQSYSREYIPRPKALLRQISAMANAAEKDRRDPYRQDILDALPPERTADAPDGTVVFRISATGEERPIEVHKVDGLWTARVDGVKLTGQTRDVLLSAVSRELNMGPRRLTDAELRECSLLVHSPSGGFWRALQRYVSIKANIPEAEVLRDETLLNPNLAEVVNEAVSYLWLALRTDFVPGSDWPEFLAVCAAGRPYSIALCDGVRLQYEKARESAARDALLSTVDAEPPAEEEVPTYRELDQLGDEELAKQLHDVKVQYGRLVRAGQL